VNGSVAVGNQLPRSYQNSQNSHYSAADTCAAGGHVVVVCAASTVKTSTPTFLSKPATRLT